LFPLLQQQLLPQFPLQLQQQQLLLLPPTPLLLPQPQQQHRRMMIRMIHRQPLSLFHICFTSLVVC